MRLIGGILYFVSILLLIVVKLDGYQAVAGADSWLRIPIFGSFQPSELSKIAVAMLSGPIFAAMENGANCLILKVSCGCLLFTVFHFYLLLRNLTSVQASF